MVSYGSSVFLLQNTSRSAFCIGDLARSLVIDSNISIDVFWLRNTDTDRSALRTGGRATNLVDSDIWYFRC